MKKEFLRVETYADGGRVESYLNVDKIIYFRRDETDPNWTTVFFEYRVVSVYMSIEDFCKALEKLSYEQERK